MARTIVCSNAVISAKMRPISTATFDPTSGPPEAHFSDTGDDSSPRGDTELVRRLPSAHFSNRPTKNAALS
jgi:hypothetical protein